MTQTYQSGYSTYLTKKLEAADTTAYIAVAPTVTKGRIFITDWVNKEWISFTGVSGLTLTWLTRWLSKTADPSTAGTGTAWIAGTEIKLVAMHDQMVDKQEATTFADTVTVSDTTVAWVRLQSLTTTQMNAIASPANGDLIYNSTAWENYQYIGWAWSAVSAGSTQANASDTVAGKVEFNTTAQSIAATDTWETGAATVNHPSDIAKNTQSATFVYGADAGGDDTYVVALAPVLAAYTTGQRLTFKVTTANTGACSVDFWPWVKSIKTLDGNDPQTGAIRASQVVTVVYDGTNMILQNEDIASTTNKGIVELATDAEVVTGTDQTRYTNALQLKANSKTVAGSTTRASWASTGSETIAHWLWQAPRLVEFYFTQNQSWATNNIMWFGYYDGTSNKCICNQDNGADANPWLNTTKSIVVQNSSWDWWTATTTVDATNITISWTKTGSGLDVDVIWKANA